MAQLSHRSPFFFAERGSLLVLVCCLLSLPYSWCTMIDDYHFRSCSFLRLYGCRRVFSHSTGVLISSHLSPSPISLSVI